MGFHGDQAATFEVVIQLGAILAVVVDARSLLWRHLHGLGTPGSRAFFLHVLIAFLPAALLGFWFHDAIKSQLFNPRNVANAMVVGAAAIFAVERWHPRTRTQSIEAIGAKQALGIGLAQCAALFPGFSRAAATILGGVLMGLDRPTAAQFSFLLAIPTLAGAAVLDLAKSYDTLTTGDLGWMGVGFVVAFFTAWAAVRWFVHFVGRHSLVWFGIYRLVVGFLVLFLLGR
jgi:undecaprenyl-diphosphatase